MQNFRSKLSDFQREQYRNHDAVARKRARAASKHQSKYVFLRILITGRKKNLPQDPAKQKLVIQAITQSIGLLGPSFPKRNTRHLSCKLKDDIVKFYCRDDISYQMPGKRDTIVVRQNGTKSTHQKRILLYNIRKVHQLFLSERSGSALDLSKTSFAELRPQYVMIKALMSHRVCVCAYHENVNLLLEALAKHVKGGFCSDLHTFTSSLVCDESNEACMFSKCKTCSKFFEIKFEENIVDFTIKIQWLQWTNNNGRSEKEESEGTVKSCVQHLSSLIQQYLSHVFIKRAQSSLFEELKESTDDKKVLLQVDCAENFAMDQQDAIQSAYWNTRMLSIFTAHAWCGANNYSFALVSDNVTHDKCCLVVCLNNIITKLKQYLPDLEEIVFFSDGAASQFKQRYLLQNMTRMMVGHTLKLSGNFSAPSHGKGVVDAIGGMVKRMVWQEVMAKKQYRSATDFVCIAKTKTNTIILDEISQTEIDVAKLRLEQIFMATKSVKDTQKLHSVIAIRSDVIECRIYGDSTSKWAVFSDFYLLKAKKCTVFLSDKNMYKH
ncbi:unnamed protein product [Rotaria socialis]|uniref:Uncharacterized protein n=2 Tax=Rotaria socialis TaxID=392032 RepID=A0A818F5Z5_9BILA|nr:unnamed protein product [Rotaria socialis]